MGGRKRVEAPKGENVVGVEIWADVLGRTGSIALWRNIERDLLEVDPRWGYSKWVV